MKLIWFDLGSTSGWAHNCDPASISHGQMEFAGNRPARLWAMFEAVDALLRGLMVDAVGYERPFARGQGATRSLWGQAGILEAVATRRGFPVLDATPAEIKAFATGKGVASKEEMTAAAIRYLESAGNDIPSVLGEHEGDAICGLAYMSQYVSKPTPKAKRKARGSRKDK